MLRLLECISIEAKMEKKQYLLGIYSREDILLNDCFIPHNNPLCKYYIFILKMRKLRFGGVKLRAWVALCPASLYACLSPALPPKAALTLLYSDGFLRSRKGKGTARTYFSRNFYMIYFPHIRGPSETDAYIV